MVKQYSSRTKRSWPYGNQHCGPISDERRWKTVIDKGDSPLYLATGNRLRA